jgi:hypothetical protein
VLAADVGRKSAEETHEFPLAGFLSLGPKQPALYTRLPYQKTRVVGCLIHIRNC